MICIRLCFKQTEKAADAIKLQIVCWEWSMAKSKDWSCNPSNGPKTFLWTPHVHARVPSPSRVLSRPRPPFLEESTPTTSVIIQLYNFMTKMTVRWSLGCVEFRPGHEQHMFLFTHTTIQNIYNLYNYIQNMGDWALGVVFFAFLQRRAKRQCRWYFEYYIQRLTLVSNASTVRQQQSWRRKAILSDYRSLVYSNSNKEGRYSLLLKKKTSLFVAEKRSNGDNSSILCTVGPTSVLQESYRYRT